MKNVSMALSLKYESRVAPKPASTSYSPPNASNVALIKQKNLLKLLICVVIAIYQV